MMIPNRIDNKKANEIMIDNIYFENFNDLMADL